MSSTPTESARELRKRAEEQFTAGAFETQMLQSLDEADLLLHDLRVHQIELEMQNDDLRRTQAELESARARYLDLYDLAPVGYLTISENGLILEANLTAATMLGVIRNVLLQNVMSKFIFTEDQDVYLLHRKRLIESGELRDWEVRMLRADGSIFWAHLQTIPESDGGFRTTFTDISESKRAEKVLQDKNTEMERFTYTVSHDLKSPLITIQTYAGMIVKDLEAGRHERAMADMKRIEDAASKMTDLLNDLLELSRVGRQMNLPSRIDMNRLVQDTLGQLAGPLKQNQIEVAVQPDLPAVFGDQKRIAEVVQNLIENAVKYRGDQKTLHIEIGTTFDGQETVFFVKDNGAGIDPLHHERIFGLFKKLDANSEGTGIGLALVKRIIEIHGGRVWVESDGEGMGSRFCFTVK